MNMLPKRPPGLRFGQVRARAISEGLKREAYKFAAEAAPYDGTDRGKAGELLPSLFTATIPTLPHCRTDESG